jgi:hypothetical protein
MSKTNTTENDTLKMLLKGVDPSYRGNANIYLALFTADPGEAGSLAAEADYTGYARQTIIKSSGWTDGGSTFTNANLIQFPQCTGGSNILTHCALVETSSGAGQVFYKGALNASLTVQNLVQPQFSIAALSVSED